MNDKLSITNFLQEFKCPYACDNVQCLQCAVFWNAYHGVNTEQPEDMHGEIMSLRAYIDNHEEIWKRNVEIDKAIVRKDTAKEILQDLKGLLEGYVNTQTTETLYVQKCKEYGVEVDNA